MVGSLGSLGIATLFQLKLVPATRFVELTYLPIKAAEAALDTIVECAQEPENDFVEGLVFGEEAKVFGIVVVGRLSAFKTERVVRFSGASDPWFHHHVAAAGATTECVPILDYLFRHDRGSFNLGRLCFGKLPFNKQTRWLADYALRSGNLAKVTQDLHWGEHLVLQDIDVPVESCLELLKWVEESVQAYPLYLCPVRQWGNGAASEYLSLLSNFEFRATYIKLLGTLDIRKLSRAYPSSHVLFC
jgi:FAD/FMN-containing dehydrogenase